MLYFLPIDSVEEAENDVPDRKYHLGCDWWLVDCPGTSRCRPRVCDHDHRDPLRLAACETRRDLLHASWKRDCADRMRHKRSQWRITDETYIIKARNGLPRITVVQKKYYDMVSNILQKVELALIVEGQYPKDNNRVLGYDCAHETDLGPVHKHEMGKISPSSLNLSEALNAFNEEVHEYLKKNGYR